MKYHYKSPEELAERAERRDSEVRGKRNRGNLVIFADLFVICLIFAGIYYSGALRPDRYVSDSTVRRSNLEFSGSLELPTDANAAMVLYLNVKLLGDQAMIFPRVENPGAKNRATDPATDAAPAIQATIEILGDADPGSPSGDASDANAAELDSRPVRFSAEYPLALRTIRPGETTIYRAELRVPGGTADLKKGDSRIRLRFPAANGDQADVFVVL
ncbi:MAG: hypothetical protein NXI24_13915 [bacterium]|nr:hypothetical protein [bacterium]